MDDVDYFRKRLRQEEQAADLATSQEAKLIHRSLAAHYARKAVVTLVTGEEGSKEGEART